MEPIRIVFIGDRDFNHRQAIREALETELRALPVDQPVVLVHGGCPSGADRQADDIWVTWRDRWITLFENPERHHAYSYKTSAARHEAMISRGAHVVISAANSWDAAAAEGARAARRTGLRVVDIGVDTAEACPISDAA